MVSFKILKNKTFEQQQGKEAIDPWPCWTYALSPSSSRSWRTRLLSSKCGCPILPSLRTYPILPRLKLVRSGLSVLSDFTKSVNLSDFTWAENWSVLPDFTKAANLSIFTRTENWSDLGCPFCPILPRLWTCPILPGLKTGPILLVCFAWFYQGW
jgi:hypothetical protein